MSFLATNALASSSTTNTKNHPSNIKPTADQNLNLNLQNRTKTPADKHLWNIATCNIRGLSEKTKRDLWLQYGKKHNWNIVISTETDGSHHHSKHWKSDYYKSWWSYGTNNLGQGVGISLENNLAKRTFKIQE